MSASDHLLVIIDPVARQCDGESVRIAKDVLSARAVTKLCLPDNPVEFARALARRGARRLVVVGDDRALLRAVTLLHREREPDACALSLVPVGTAVSLAHSLGVPVGAVAAARAVLQGAVRRQDLLVDDGGGVVLGGLRIPPGAGADGLDGAHGADGVDLPAPRADAPSARAADGTPAGAALPGGAGREAGAPEADDAGASGDASASGDSGGSGGSGGPGGSGGSGGSGGARRRGQSLVRTLAGRRGTAAGQNRVLRRRGRRSRIVLPRPTRLRVEADGVPLVDVDQPVEAVRIAPGTGGLARVEIRPAGGTTPGAAPSAKRPADPSADPSTDAGWLLADARTVTVSGADFHYWADMLVAGPVRERTWTVRANAWGLTLPG